jgi:hypothetical protein
MPECSIHSLILFKKWDSLKRYNLIQNAEPAQSLEALQNGESQKEWPT